MSETKKNMTIDEDLANALGVDTSPEQMVSEITMAIKPMAEVTLTVTRLLSPKFIERMTAHKQGDDKRSTVEHTLAGQVLVSSVSKEAGLDLIGDQAAEIVRLRDLLRDFVALLEPIRLDRASDDKRLAELMERAETLLAVDTALNLRRGDAS